MSRKYTCSSKELTEERFLEELRQLGESQPNEERIAFLVEENEVSVECATAYLELEEWGHSHHLSVSALENAIEGIATLFGWDEEETAKEWTFHVTADQILDLCDEYASRRNTVRRSMVLRELFDGGTASFTILALATLVDACGAELAVSVVKALLKPHVTC